VQLRRLDPSNSLQIGKAQTRWQQRPQDAIFSGQIQLGPYGQKIRRVENAGYYGASA
jgi:hypothetical protein